MIELFAALATWRMARMLALETGPFALFERYRAFFATLAKGQADYTRKAWLIEGASCVACLSCWIGLFVSLLIGGDVLTIVLRGLAFSAVSVLLMRLVG